MSRQKQRSELRKMGEFVAKSIAPVTRPQRRLAGRVYANAAYRRINKLDHAIYGGGPHGYMEFNAHPDVVGWMEREWKKVLNGNANPEAREK